MRTDAQTGKDRQDMMTLTGAVHNFANAPKNAFNCQYVLFVSPLNAPVTTGFITKSWDITNR